MSIANWRIHSKLLARNRLFGFCEKAAGALGSSAPRPAGTLPLSGSRMGRTSWFASVGLGAVRLGRLSGGRSHRSVLGRLVLKISRNRDSVK